MQREKRCDWKKQASSFASRTPFASVITAIILAKNARKGGFFRLQGFPFGARSAAEGEKVVFFPVASLERRRISENFLLRPPKVEVEAVEGREKKAFSTFRRNLFTRNAHWKGRREHMALKILTNWQPCPVPKYCVPGVDGEEDPLVQVGHLFCNGQGRDVVDVRPLLALLQGRQLQGEEKKRLISPGNPASRTIRRHPCLLDFLFPPATTTTRSRVSHAYYTKEEEREKRSLTEFILLKFADVRGREREREK